MPPIADDETRGLISAGKVQGTAVYDAEGERLGHVEDLMLHKLSGKVAYAVMALGGFLGLGERYHPLPWGLLTYDTQKGGYVVPIAKERLQGGPDVSRDEALDDDSGWGERVHAYYQLAPSWM